MVENTMTEIEKQFFDTFGIEDKEVKTKKCCDCSHNEVALDAPCYVCTAEKCPYVVRKRPQITDRILLELICIANHESVYIDFEGTDVETLKNSLLGNFIFFKNIVPRQQVQKLFKE